VAQCLEEVSVVLPPPFHDLLHTPVGFLERNTVDLLAKNLVDKCRHNCAFPYLDEQDKRRIVRAVVMVIMEGMKEGKTLKSFAQGMETDSVAQDIVVEVFIEGAMDVFFDDEMRQDMVTDLASYVEDVPFIPHAVIEKLADKIMKAFSEILREALKEAFATFKKACAQGQKLPVLPAPLDDEDEECQRVQDTWKNKPFVVQLRRIFILRLLEGEAEIMGKAARFIKAMLPERSQALWLGRLVDIIFEQIAGLDKIEETIQPFHAHVHGHHGSVDVECVSLCRQDSFSLCRQDSWLESDGTLECDGNAQAPQKGEAEAKKIASTSSPEEVWQPECFISHQQPFGFSDSVAADYCACDEDSTSSETLAPAVPPVRSLSPGNILTTGRVSSSLCDPTTTETREVSLVDGSILQVHYSASGKELSPCAPKPSRSRPNPVSTSEFQERIAALELKVIGEKGNGNIVSRLTMLERSIAFGSHDHDFASENLVGA
jgi:hypothetical protein